MQCPLMSMCCCLLSPKVVFSVLGIVSLALGVLSAFQPLKSIGFYQGIMEKFNWKVAPIDEAREVRNTVRMGFWLIVLGVALIVLAAVKF